MCSMMLTTPETYYAATTSLNLLLGVVGIMNCSVKLVNIRMSSSFRLGKSESLWLEWFKSNAFDRIIRFAYHYAACLVA